MADLHMDSCQRYDFSKMVSKISHNLLSLCYACFPSELLSSMEIKIFLKNMMLKSYNFRALRSQPELCILIFSKVMIFFVFFFQTSEIESDFFGSERQFLLRPDNAMLRRRQNIVQIGHSLKMNISRMPWAIVLIFGMEWLWGMRLQSW